MSNTNVFNNGVNEAGVYNQSLSPDRCPVVRARGPDPNQSKKRLVESDENNVKA